MTISNEEILSNDKNITVFFDITKENYEIYLIFDSLYKDIISGNVFGIDSPYSECVDYTKTDEYKNLVDKDFNINWISDEGLSDVEDKLKISVVNNDTYRLTFSRNNTPIRYGLKNTFGMSIRVRNSGSRYYPFNCVFMRMYYNLQNIDLNYHQIHLEEIMYMKNLIR